METVIKEAFSDGGFTVASRGPRPPALVCSACDATIVACFENPLLKFSKERMGRYQGETTGGVGLCEACLGTTAHPAGEKQGVPATIVDCPANCADAVMANYTVDSENRKAVAAAYQWLSTEGRDLFLFGPTGTGKTRLAISLARYLAVSARYVRVPALLRQIKDAFGGETLFPLQPFVNVPLLILDDIGAEKPSAFTMQTIETLYTERLDAGRRTIFTSNLPMSTTTRGTRTLSEQLDDARFLSRLFGAADQIEIRGVDRRLR